MDFMIGCKSIHFLGVLFTFVLPNVIEYFAKNVCSLIDELVLAVFQNTVLLLHFQFVVYFCSPTAKQLSSVSGFEK